MIILIILDILIILLIRLWQKKSTPSTRRTPSNSRAAKSTERMDTKSDEEDRDCAKRVKINKHRLPVTKAGRVSMKNMEISQHISSTRPYEGALPLIGFNLNFGRSSHCLEKVRAVTD